MTTDNYLKHISLIGRYALLWDNANDESSVHNTLRAITMDMAASGLSQDLPLSDLVAHHQTGWKVAIGSVEQLRTIAVNLGTSHFKLRAFKSDLEHFEPANTTLTAIFTAFSQEMDEDGQSFTTRSSSGIVHFLDLLATAAPDWPQDGVSPTLPDESFTSSIVPTQLSLVQILTIVNHRGF